MSIGKLDLQIRQGETFARVLRWAQPSFAYKAISSATRAAPCVLTVTSHGLPAGWVFRIADAQGMTEINSENRAVNNGYYVATVRDANTIELNDVDAVAFGSYAGRGVISYQPPVDMTGYTARMQIRASVDDPAVLIGLTTANGRIDLDSTNARITLSLSSTDTAAFDWTSGVYDLEMISPAGDVTALVGGKVTIVPEVTR